MSKIEMMEVNQHTSDEVAKVLADLKAQGVDLAAVGANIEAIKTALANSGGGIKSVQRGTISIAEGALENSATINAVNLSKAFILHGGTKVESTGTANITNRNAASMHAALEFSGATKVRAVRGYTAFPAYVLFHVVEFA